MTSAENVQATFCATLVDEWARAGVTDAVVCPGSRSTPMALALAADDRIRVHVRLDERSAAFVAVGLGVATGRPAVVLTTSGTAAVELHPAVVEAWHASVPLLAVTADRPPELHHVGAPQTVDQQRLYGGAVVASHDPGVPVGTTQGLWRSIGARVVLDALDRPGPVHLNLPFREPLVGDPGPLPPGRTGGAPWHRRTPVDLPRSGRLSGRGVIVAGGGAPEAELVHGLARQLDWPVLADPRSGCRVPRHTTVAAADAILRTWRPPEPPEVIVRLGDAWASKVVNGWIAECGAVEVVVDPRRRWVDADRSAAVLLDSLPEAAAGAHPNRPWLAAWREAEQLAQAAIDGVLDGAGPSEPGTIRGLGRSLPDGAVLVVSSSMPVRDAEWYLAPRDGLRVVANRGANGIDGVVSTATGVAFADPARPVTVVVGDLAFVHDIGALAAGLPPNLDVVVLDNDGGGIFSFLPQATTLPRQRFEQLFGTPHGLDLERVAAGFGATVTVVRTERDANVALHEQLHAAVAKALSG